jgi:hypothetical protein
VPAGAPVINDPAGGRNELSSCRRWNKPNNRGTDTKKSKNGYCSMPFAPSRRCSPHRAPVPSMRTIAANGRIRRFVVARKCTHVICSKPRTRLEDTTSERVACRAAPMLGMRDDANRAVQVCILRLGVPCSYIRNSQRTPSFCRSLEY